MRYDRNIADKTKEHPKLFHRFIRNRLTVKEQTDRLSSLEGKDIDTNKDICMKLNTKF